MPLSCRRFIAAHNRCASGLRSALPAYSFSRLILTSDMSQFGPAPGSLIETRGCIITAAPPFGCGLTALLLQIEFILLAVRMPRFVMRKDVFLRMAVHNVDGAINIVTRHIVIVS